MTATEAARAEEEEEASCCVAPLPMSSPEGSLQSPSEQKQRFMSIGTCGGQVSRVHCRPFFQSCQLFFPKKSRQESWLDDSSPHFLTKLSDF